jgi:endopolyphosphatase
LHITDFHPDPHYVAGATFETGCHRKPEKKGKGKGKDKGLDEGEELDELKDKWGSAVS